MTTRENGGKSISKLPQQMAEFFITKAERPLIEFALLFLPIILTAHSVSVRVRTTQKPNQNLEREKKMENTEANQNNE